MFNHLELNLSLNTSSLTASNLTMESTESFKPGEFVMLKFLLGLFSFFGFVENVAVIVVFLTSHILHDIPSSWFVLSLVVADTLSCVYASVAFVHFHPTNHLPKDLRSLRYMPPLGRISYLSSLFVLIFNRFLSIYDSLKYPSRIIRGRAKRLIFLVWSVVFLITILCHVSTLLEFLSHIYITLVSFFIIAFNVYLLKKARDQHRTIKRHTVVITGEKKSMTSEYRSLFRLTMVTFTFAVVAIYNVVFTIFRFSRPTKEYFSYQRMVVACNILFAINSSFDPFVY